MGFYIPPPPVPPDVLKRRIEAGARTLEELDPELAAWQRTVQRDITLRIITLVGGLIVIAITFLLSLIL